MEANAGEDTSTIASLMYLADGGSFDSTYVSNGEMGKCCIRTEVQW